MSELALILLVLGLITLILSIAYLVLAGKAEMARRRRRKPLV